MFDMALVSVGLLSREAVVVSHERLICDVGAESDYPSIASVPA